MALLRRLLTRASLVQVARQPAAVAWVAQTAQRLGLDLPYSLARNAHLPADFFQRVALTVEQTIAQLKNADLARRKRIEDFLQVLAQQALGDRLGRGRRLLVLDEIAQHRVFFLVGRRFERPRTPGDLGHVLALL